MSSSGFIKLIKSDLLDEILEFHPNAFLLLTLIARRVKREDSLKLKAGQCYIGDFAKCGLTRQKYRTAIADLVKMGIVTIKATNKGTVATLVTAMVYDCNAANTNQQANQTITIQQPTDNQQATTNKNKRNKEEKKEVSKEVVEIINYLNEKMNASYKTTTKETQRLINGRLSEGHEVKDFLSVIDKKINQWKGTEREIYIRPSTLFSPSKFEGYVNESDVSKVIPLSAVPRNGYQAKKEQQALEDQKKMDEYWKTGF